MERVNLRKRKQPSDEEKAADRQRHRVENLPENRLDEVRAAHRVANLPEERIDGVRADSRRPNPQSLLN